MGAPEGVARLEAVTILCEYKHFQPLFLWVKCLEGTLSLGEAVCAGRWKVFLPVEYSVNSKSYTPIILPPLLMSNGEMDCPGTTMRTKT